jgi:hypothetical protein
MSYSDSTALARIQEQTDDLLRLRNQSAPRALDGETVQSYRARMLSRVQEGAPGLKDINVRDARGSALDLLEKQIYEEARREARNPTTIPDGELREVKETDTTGRVTSKFFGRPSAWMSQFSTGKKRVVGIRTENQRGYIPNS